MPPFVERTIRPVKDMKKMTASQAAYCKHIHVYEHVSLNIHHSANFFVTGLYDRRRSRWGEIN